MSGSELLLTTFNGLSFAGLLFLVASGFTLIFSLMGVLNLAHGTFYLWGGYLGLVTLGATGSWLVALLVGALGVAVGGGILERVVYRRVRGLELSEVLLSVGVSLVLADLALARFGGDSLTIDPPGALAGSVALGDFVVPKFRLAVIVAALVVAIGLWVLLKRTRVGAIIRAGVDDEEMLDALGVNVRRVAAGVFVLGALLAGASGVVGGVFFGVYPGADAEMLLFALVVVVVGGLGSLQGAVLGALAVGLVYSFGVTLASDLLYFILFGPMLLVLVARPRGLLGGRL
ncbi:branched-chain amino acid ABC transporter permease [Kribbella sp. NPDC049174]|uniref:branched-chain amino acid ABC transporter permease n=1 Tax=Kribbella sp. NPDC049174 TaxID=3364112 RepID=UPI00371FEA0C